MRIVWLLGLLAGRATAAVGSQAAGAHHSETRSYRGPFPASPAQQVLQAYEAAGADVLYAPGLRTVAEVRDVVGALKRPFNIVTGRLDPDITAIQLAEDALSTAS